VAPRSLRLLTDCPRPVVNAVQHRVVLVLAPVS
jgi:hypothetical protein